jgi:fatty-acyl-CoA synthase
MPVDKIQVTPSAYTYPLLIKQLLHTPLATAPDQEIVYADKRRHTYREFARRVNRLGHALTDMGLHQGDTVAVMDWDSHRYLECFFSIPMLGAVLMTVNIRLSPDQILYTLNHSGASVLFIHQDFLPVLEQIKLELLSVKKIVLLADGEMAVPSSFVGEYEALLAACRDTFDFPDFDENARATTFYTTGTTGLPKGVYFSHRQLVLHTLGVGMSLALAEKQGGLHRGDVYMPLTPMFHVHAWGLPYIATLAGVKQVYPGRYVPDTLLALIDKEKVTFSHCVPTILLMLLQSPASKNVDLSKWRVIVGGSALTTGLAKTALERGVDVFTAYGMSETCPILTFAQLDAADLSADFESQVATRVKTGRPVALVDLRAVDSDLLDVPHDGKSTGEVVARAPWLTQGYLKNPEASETLWQGGWLHTQDIGHFDARGYLQVTDRLKDVIKTGGEWVSSLELEDVIGRCQGVSEVAVIGVADIKWGERPLALVVLKPEAVGKLTIEDVQAHVKRYADEGKISKFAVPENVRFVEALARTSVGKLNKRVMREQNA